VATKYSLLSNIILHSRGGNGNNQVLTLRRMSCGL